MSTQSTSAILAEYRKTHGHRLNKKSVVARFFDAHHQLEHTEDTLDIWWSNLTPEHKAAIYGLDLGPAEALPMKPFISAVTEAKIREVEEALAAFHASPNRIVEVARASV